MEHQKLSNLMKEAHDFKFVTRKWNIANANSNYDMANEITYNTEVLKSIRSNYKDAYILVKGTSTIKGYWT